MYTNFDAFGYNLDRLLTKFLYFYLLFCSWFAVHCTSMQNTNKLISGDNKGYASMLFEMEMNPREINGQVENVPL